MPKSAPSKPSVIHKDDSYAINAIHIRKKDPAGYRILRLKRPNSDRQEMEEITLYEDAELSLKDATEMSLEYAIEENEENISQLQWIFLPECDKVL
ncbi:MAG: hypothetical protein IBX43_07275 [Campylobacterales bacterium]|nr:hypothetical protein [Campylobacterales bacterium]